MAELNWGLLKQPNFADALATGEHARQVDDQLRAQQQQQQATRDAFKLYAANPETGIKAVLAVDPVTGIKLQTDERAEARQTRQDTISDEDRANKAKAQLADAAAHLPKGEKRLAFVTSVAPYIPGVTPQTIEQIKPHLDDDDFLQAMSGHYAEGTVVAPGAHLIDKTTGRSMYDAPFAPHYEKLGPGDTLGVVGGAGGQPPQPGSPATSPAGAPRSVRNNNPGNIEDGPFARAQPGYQGSDGRFAKFADPDTGKQAQVALLGRYGKRGLNTVSGIINTWAPPSDNNPTPAYAQYVAKRLGVDPNAPLDMNDPRVLHGIADAIGEFEGSPRSASNAAAPQNAAQPAAAQNASGFQVLAKGPDKPVSRPATAQEKAAYGIADSVPAQMKPDGTIDVINGAQGGLSPAETRKSSVILRKEFEGLPDVKSYQTVATQFDVINRLAKAKPTAANDISSIFAYMKILDPTSVVREGEFATAQNATGVPGQVVNAYNKVISGQRLNPQQRQEYVEAASRIYDANKTRYDQLVGQYQGYAKGLSLPEDTIQPRVAVGGSSQAKAFPFKLSPAQEQWRAQSRPARDAASLKVPGSVNNPAFLNPADPNSTYGNLAVGAYFIDPHGRPGQKKAR